MKYAEFRINSNKIEFSNSLFGFETVLLDGKSVSKIFSVNGATHKFVLNSNKYVLESNYKLFDKREINLKLTNGDKILESKNVKMSMNHRFFWVAFSIFLGISFYKLLNFLV
jgi:aspartate 1-decarboxylase